LVGAYFVSSYSTLVLAANVGVVAPSATAIFSLWKELGLLHSERGNDEFGNLAEDLSAIFDDDSASAENEHFFCPDTISFAASIEVLSNDGIFEGSGWSVCIHGNGYFFPWDRELLCQRFLRSPKLIRLQAEISESFGGRFVFPKPNNQFLRDRWLDGDIGWMWFASESM